MNTIKSILVVLNFPREPSGTLPFLVSIASQLRARVFLLVYGEAPASRQELETKLGLVPLCDRIIVTRSQGDLGKKVRSLCRKFECDFVAMSLPHPSAEAKTLGDEIQTLVQNAPVPVMLVPFAYHGGPVLRSILVPMSGELRENVALQLAVELGHALSSTVHILHVVNPGPEEIVGAKSLSQLPDQAQHEYGERIDALIAEACPFVSLQKRQTIGQVHVRSGDVATRIREEVRDLKPDLVAAQWQGYFQEGHTKTVESLLRSASCPVLLVKSRARDACSLKIGKPFAVSRPA